jgi:hypothetical protein
MKVRYKGFADERTITRKQLDAVGVVIDHDLKWDRSNGFSQVVDVNERLEEVLRGEQHFTLHALDDSGGEKVVAVASNPDAESDVVVDGNTGQTEVNKRKQQKDAEAQAPQDSGSASHGRTGKGSSTSGTA